MLGDRIWGSSGYSQVVYQTCTRLAKLGHSVAHIPTGQSMRGGKLNYQGVLIYPGGSHPFGEDVAISHYIDFKADMLITIKDVWLFDNLTKWAINWCPMCPIDHSPISPQITVKLPTTFKNIAISRFGQAELKRRNIDSTYIPHAIPTDIFKPLERKAECRKMWFFEPDEFVVGIVAMNRSRKMIPRMLQGYKRFIELNPTVKTHLMLWSDVYPMHAPEDPTLGVADVGVNLLPEIIELGLGEAVRWPDSKLIRETIPEWAGDDYVGGWDMVKLYNSFDVLVLCSGGEGFGLPLVEAQACGVSVITTDYAAGPELVGAGLTVKADDYVVLNTPGTRYALASIDGMAEALTKIYNADRAKLAKRARLFAERYSWNNIFKEYWQPFLTSCEEDLKPLITKKGDVKTWA